jgi:hypothetical protein
MGKRKNKSKTVGSMLAMTGGHERVGSVTAKRTFLVEKYPYITSTPALTSSQTPFQSGSRWAAGTLTFRAGDLDSSAVGWITKYDSFRILGVDVYANLSFVSRRSSDFTAGGAPVVLYVAEDLDVISTVQASWSKIRNRHNLRRVVFQQGELSKKIASISPRPSFKPTSDSIPSAMLPNPSDWVDATAYNMEYAGLEIFAACPFSTDVVAGSGDYAFNLTFETRMVVEVKGGI